MSAVDVADCVIGAASIQPSRPSKTCFSLYGPRPLIETPSNVNNHLSEADRVECMKSASHNDCLTPNGRSSAAK